MQKKKTYLYVFLFFLILSALFFFLLKLSIFKPILSFGRDLMLPISSTIGSNMGDSKAKGSESVLLQAEKLVDQSKIIADNKALRDQFETAILPTQSLVEAKIVGMPSFIPGVTVPEYFVLNKGLAQGIKKDLAVIYKDNLVGFVTDTSENFSKVQLVSNSRFSQTAQILGSDVSGVTKGQGGGSIILDNVVLSQSLKKDELVITKGDQDLSGKGVIPGLVIGKIISVNKNPSSLFQIAKVESLLNFSKLSTVFVVK